jgi:hypothetical protein
MTDLFVEQPEDELLSTLTAAEEPPFWDIPDEIGEYVEDIGLVIDEVFAATPEDEPWWQHPKGQVSRLAKTLKDFVSQEGTFAPPDPEDATVEDRLGQIAQEIMPKGTGTDKGESSGTDAIKALHFEQMTGEETFVKFINWLRKSGVTLASREGAGLGMSTIYEAAAGGGLGRVSPAFQGETAKPTANIFSLASDVGQEKLVGYLQGNWRNIPDLLELVQQNVAENWSTFMSGVVDGKKPQTLETAVSDPNVFGDLMRQFGGYGDGTTILANVDDAFGGGSAQDILGGALEAAIQMYAAELSKGDPSMMIGPDLGEEGGQVGFITSFDGTPYGDIKSVNDLFSGGKLGQLDAYKYMRTLYDNTKDSTGYSPIIDQIQQELFAWGILDPTAGFEWGKLDIPGMAGMADRTVDALQMFQVDIINEALQVPEGELHSDATPYIETVMRRLISRNVSTGELQNNQSFKQQEDVIKEVSRRIQQRISDNPNRLINNQGIKELEATITEMMGDLGVEQREKYFGRGGSANQQQLVNLLMSDFYGDSDWGSQIFFGSRNTDDDFMRYAHRAGALNENEISLLNRGKLRPENYRDNWDPNDVGALQNAEQDVVTANLVKFITDHGGWDDPDALRKGMITYAHTIGQRTASERGYSNEDYGRMVDKAMQIAKGTPAESPLVTTLDDRLAQSMDLVGGGGPDFRRLMDSVNSRRKSLNTLRVRNV